MEGYRGISPRSLTVFSFYRTTALFISLNDGVLCHFSIIRTTHPRCNSAINGWFNFLHQQIPFKSLRNMGHIMKEHGYNLPISLMRFFFVMLECYFASHIYQNSDYMHVKYYNLFLKFIYRTSKIVSRIIIIIIIC